MFPFQQIGMAIAGMVISVPVWRGCLRDAKAGQQKKIGQIHPSAQNWNSLKESLAYRDKQYDIIRRGCRRHLRMS
jgi:hypothetical protein